MKDGEIPNPNKIHPIAGYDNEIYIALLLSWHTRKHTR